MKKTIILTSVITALAVTLAVMAGTYLIFKKDFTHYDNDYLDYISGEGNTEPISVTMIELISNPQNYDGKAVRVIGVGNLEYEGDYLSVDKESWEYSVYNSLWLELDGEKVSYDVAKAYNGKYVIVEGIFSKDDHGHLDMHRGSIKNVSRYDLWEK